jgi:glycosyltransferase involved in cell wall biosynthesis
MKKLAIITTHPIQYHVPWLVRLAEQQIHVKVFYTWEQSRDGLVYDPGFGKNIQWDIPLLEGYEYEFVQNTAARPGTERFMGIINPGLIKKIESWGPDSLLVFGWNYYSHLQCVLHFHGRVPVFFRGDSVLLHEKRGLRKIARRIFLTWVYRHIDRALYVGTNNKSYYLKHGLKPSQLLFSPQAIDIDRFSEPDADYSRRAGRWKKALGIPGHHITVLYAGKMTTVKNPYFVLALAEACAALPVSFIMVGDGHLKEDLQKRAEGMGNVVFLDFQNQRIMPIIYRMGDVFIMPSVSETWGMGISEAMASGRPVMASEKVGCAADLVLENKTGITFGADDTDKCVRFLESLCADRSLLTEMGTCSRALIRFFSFSQIVESVAQALDQPVVTSRRRVMTAALWMGVVAILSLIIFSRLL